MCRPKPGDGFSPQHSSEAKVKAGTVEKVALVAIAVCVSQALDEDWLEARHIVIEFDGAERQMIAYVEIKPAANLHGKRVRIIDEPLRDCGIPDLLRGTGNAKAARVVGSAKQGLDERSRASQTSVDPGTEHVSKQRLVNVEIMNISIMHGIEAGNCGEPVVEAKRNLAYASIGRKCRNIDSRVDAGEGVAQVGLEFRNLSLGKRSHGQKAKKSEHDLFH